MLFLSCKFVDFCNLKYNPTASGASVVMFHGDLPYSSKDIIRKLETLNEEHIIGCGGFGMVYRLAMDDGNVFALKKIVKINDGFDRFFERELEILGSIKHRHLVNLRGYCNSPTAKLLIYDFLPGGSLDEALHGECLSLSKFSLQKAAVQHTHNVSPAVCVLAAPDSTLLVLPFILV